MAQPSEPAEIPRTVATNGEAPGEILRRQARDLLDEIPAAELPPALAFLEFLRDRGPSSLLGGNSAAAERRRAAAIEDDDDDDDTVDTVEPAVGAR